MPCPKCHQFESNKYCDACIRAIESAVQGARRQILNMAIMFAGYGESGYLRNNVVYTDSPHAHGAAQGSADGFLAVRKKFTFVPNGNFTPSQAVKNFIFPSVRTVCECRSFMSGLYCNGVRVILNKICPLLFDDVFPTINISCDDDDAAMNFLTKKKITEKDISEVMPGDWIWIPNPDPGYRDVSGSKVTSGAASGWNRICVTTLPERRYIGFGLSQGRVQAKTLEEVLEFLLEEAKKNKSVSVREVEKPKARRQSLELPQKTANRLVTMANTSSYFWSKYSLDTARLAVFVRTRLNTINQNRQ